MASWDRLNGAKAFVEAGIKGLPDFYIKPEEDRPTADELKRDCDIPVIDLTGLQDANQLLIDMIRNAAETVGFFQVVNHGVDICLMQQMIDVAREFFNLPLNEKMVHYTTDINSPVRYGTSFNPLKEDVLDWHDHILHRFLPENSEAPHPWPLKPPSYREVGQEYLKQVSSLARRLLRALSLGLGLEAKHLGHAFGIGQAVLGLNYYPACFDPTVTLGLSPHSDIGGLTFLLQDDVPGLQVKVDGRWGTVKPRRGSFVVNICDQLQIMSNGRYKSGEHRVIVNSDKDRISAGLFWDPLCNVRVAPIPELLDADHPPVYGDCVYQDYINNLYSNQLAKKHQLNQY